jgi:PilZ domain
MEGQKYCVYNQTRECFLSLGVTVADSSSGHLYQLIERLSVNADSGLWMTPYRGLPPVSGISPVDLVYLDSEYRVIQEVESFPTSKAELLDHAASALVLPVHTIYSSQTQPGDQLVICVANEMEQRLERLSSSFTSSPNTSSVVSSREKQPENGVGSPITLPIHAAREETMFQGSETVNSFEPRTGKPSSLKTWLQNWLSSDRRRAQRQPLPGLVAYYWTGSAPRAYQIADISNSGFYLLTEERWFPGTMVLMTLQRTDSSGRNLDDSVAVQSRVVRWGSDGLGLAFVVSRADTNGRDVIRDNGVDKKTLERFLGRLKDPDLVLRAAGR